MKNNFSIVITACVFLGISGCTGKQEKNDPPLNILIVTADDLNYNSVGAFGCTIPGITPNIDKLAAAGIRFTNAHTPTAVCQPCRQSIMTGRYPHNNGAEGFEPIDLDVPTLPEQLNKAGYLNGILGKEIHHQPRERFFWDFMPHSTEPDSIWRKGHSRTPELFHKYSLEFFTMAKEQGKPFFLLANSHDPHRPFVGSASDSASWGDTPPPVTRQFSPEEIEMLGYLPDIPKVRKEVAQYYGTVYRCDQNIGAVLDALKESGMEENTLVIFFSDHGASFPFAKSQCYLNSTKTPWIVRWPGKVKPGSVDNSHFISGIDIMPTVLDALNLPTVPEMDGHSHLPLLLGKEQKDRDDVFTTYYQIFARIRFPMRCVQNNEFGYIYNFWSDGKAEMRGDAMGGITWRAMVEAAKNDESIAQRVELYKHRVPEEFYDFKNDPDALHNLIDDPEYAAEIDKLRARMAELMEKYHDPALEAFKNRDKPGAIGEFMEQQRERARNTKPVERF